MKNVLVPEVLSKNNNISKQGVNKLNINLNKNVDRRRYNIHQEYTTTNTNITNTTVNKGGFFRFILDLVTLPFRLVFNMCKHVYIKYDLYGKFKLELIENKRQRIKNKYWKKYQDIYNQEEIF